MPSNETLGTLQQLAMLAVHRAGADAHGSRLQEELETHADRRVTISTVYVTLDRLEGRGFVRSWLGDATPVRGGKPRRHYALTERGVEALREARDVMDRMWKGVELPGRAS